MDPYFYEIDPDDFPDANFTVCIPSNELDEVIINKEIVAIKCAFVCHCYDHFLRKTEFYICRKQSMGITNRDLINCLIENNYYNDCDHSFLEEFCVDTESQVSPFFGS
jgi:hypothetical protein